jgi:hypothetical protein
LELTGRLMGKALWDGVLLDAALAPFFVHKLTGQHSYLEELPQLDAVLYQSLMQLKRYEGDVTDLCLDFTVRDFTLPWAGCTRAGGLCDRLTLGGKHGSTLG